MKVVSLFFVLLGTTFSLCQGKLVCDVLTNIDHPYYPQYGDYCYFLITTFGYTFDFAQNACNENEAELTSIHGLEEDAFLATLDYGEGFIGLHNASGTLQWSDGSPTDYLNFAPGQLDSRPADCAGIKDGLWYNINCTDFRKIVNLICKKKLVDIPETPADDCPSSTMIYNDYGTFYSPGYPERPKLPIGKVCYYQLKAKEGYKVVLDMDQWSCGSGIVQVYEGWTVDPKKLLKESYGEFSDPVSTVDSNLMLVLFWTSQDVGFEDVWKFEFYSEHAHLSTKDPSLPTTTPFSTTNCPKDNAFTLESIITSPGFPFAYEPNTDCTYYAIHPSGHCEMFQIEVVELNIGSDDYVDFFDTRTGEVFASTKTNLIEGSQFRLDATIGIHFRSGKVAETFGAWRFAVGGYCH